MGGTFDVLHRGHRLLLDTAFKDPQHHVFIGVTDDAFAARGRDRKVRTAEARVAALRAFLDTRGYGDRAEVAVIHDVFGRALEPLFTRIVVTRETAGGAAAINAERAGRGVAPLEVVFAPYALADDGLPVKATRVARGEVDADGRLAMPVRVSLGSSNPVKRDATASAFARVFGGAKVMGHDVASGVPDQPRGDETWTGALARARAARALDPEASFAVGIEAGLIDQAGRVFDVHIAAVLDRGGRVTWGHGPGFQLPEAALHEVEKHGRTVGDAIGDLAGDPDIGRGEGAVGFLSRGRVDRLDLAREAVLAALVPRIRPDLYGLAEES